MRESDEFTAHVIRCIARLQAAGARLDKTLVSKWLIRKQVYV